MSIINGIGITCGVHRLFTHKSYKVIAPLKIFLLVCFTSAGQVRGVHLQIWMVKYNRNKLNCIFFSLFY